jgi:hypothetical protein
MMSLVRLGITGMVLSLFLLGCGGGELPKPKPVTNKIDEMYIARIPPDQRPEVSSAQNEFQLARSNRMTAQEDFNKAETDVQLAQAEVDKASIEERSAQLKKKDAEKSHDMTQINAASAELRAAELGRRAADKHVAFAKARRDYMKMVLRFQEFEVINKEARFELEKAKVAKANNIRPQEGFAYEQFESQQKDRSESAQRAKGDAEQRRSKMVDTEREWKAAEKEWNSARGVKEPPPPATELKGSDAEKQQPAPPPAQGENPTPQQ